MRFNDCYRVTQKKEEKSLKWKERIKPSGRFFIAPTYALFMEIHCKKENVCHLFYFKFWCVEKRKNVKFRKLLPRHSWFGEHLTIITEQFLPTESDSLSIYVNIAISIYILNFRNKIMKNKKRNIRYIQQNPKWRNL